MVEVSSDVIDKIIKIVKNGGGEVFEQEGYINFCGVRNNQTNNTFNDTLYIYWKDGGKFKCVRTTGFTTKPGMPVFLNTNGKQNSKGAAIVKEGWHKDVWHIGIHCKGRASEHRALRQDQGVTKPITITRDKTQYGLKGNKYELRIFENTTEKGYPYTNMHRSSVPQSANVNTWSAGCQVFKVEKEFSEMLKMAEYANKKGQKFFSYFLTNKTVFDNNGVADNSKNTSYDFSQSQFAGSMANGVNSSTSSSGAYGGCGGVYQLGNYTNCPDANVEHKQTQNREDVLNTLVSGSYTPNEIKKCKEFLSSEKKKNIKTKSKK